ncbi:unnamed protein product, partial [Iphiclides podalirius]
MWMRILLVLCSTALSIADRNYENNLTKLWSLAGASKSDESAVVNVTSASIVIQPKYDSSQIVSSRKTKDLKGTSNYEYAFKPHAIPLQEVEQQQFDKNIYYSQNDVNGKYKSEILFPGNYHQIAKEKGNEDLVKASPYNPLNEGSFHPIAIPIIRSPNFQPRLLDEDEEPIIEKPEGFSEQLASGRSLSYVLGAEDDEEPEEEEEEEEDGEYDVGEEADKHKHGYTHDKIKKKLKRKTKKMTKYMMPLLMAYKLKYFALVPVMIAGLILLIGATGLAGFFFALFAAVMGLQKGGY